MKNYYKKTLFIIAGLSVIGASFFFSKSNIVEAAIKDGEKFGDWNVSCVKNNNKKQLCFLAQQVTTTKDDKAQIVAAYQIGYFGKDKKLNMTQILPLGLNLLLGTSIISSEKLIAPGKFTTCIASGCFALAEISNQDLETLLSSTNNAIGFINAEGKQINLPISTKGLKEGLAALK